MAGKLDKARFEAAFSRSKEAASSTESAEKDPRVQELWALIEPALEDKGRFETEIRTHLAEATADIQSWRSARNLAMYFTIAVIVLTILSLGRILCSPSTIQLYGIMSDTVQVALLAGHFAIIFGLTAMIMRGAFTPTRREETGTILPESAKMLASTLADILKAK